MRRFYSGQLHFSLSEKLQQVPGYKDVHNLEIIARCQHPRFSHVGDILTCCEELLRKKTTLQKY